MRIEDHALIGDGRSAALVSRTGAINWLCWPRFDSAPIFGALLDPIGGSWRIAPVGDTRVTRRYVDDTNVLETQFEGPGGTLVLTDVMTVADECDKGLVPDHELLRLVTCKHGEVEVELTIDPRPEFLPVRGVERGSLGLRWQLGSRLLALRGDIPVPVEGELRFRLRAGEAASFSLTFDEGPAVLVPLGEHARDRIARSVAWWRAWAARCGYTGFQRDRVIRSALAIKLMGFAPSGAVVAAPTTSLPERVGADLNWDYRFCWLRDASFTARVFIGLGYLEEAEAFVSWLLHTTRLTAPELRVIYDVYGNAPIPERELPWLRGYRDSRPVRIGNAASDQLQLDMYGEVIDAAAQLAQITGYLDQETQRLLRDFGEYVCSHWRLPDQGIWEPRTPPDHRTHSRVLCWVALDRLVSLYDRGILDCLDIELVAAHREAIRRDIESRAWDRERGCYTATLGGRELDASLFLMSYYGFHPASSRRMRSTCSRIMQRLGAGPGLLYRYEDSLRVGEGAFWICSFWAAEHLARGGGALSDARAMFDAACAYENDVGLMAEEVDPNTREAIGNFPQAYTHVGLICAALSLDERARELPDLHVAPGRRRYEVRP